MIASVPYSVFDLPQLLTLSDQSYKIVKDRYSEEVLLSGVLQNLSDAMEEARLAVGSTERETLTDQVELRDARRDDNFVGLRKHIEAGLKRHSMPAYQQASMRLIDIFNQNGSTLYRYSYSNQTAAMESLFKDLESKQAEADIDTVNANKWLKELKADHEAFKAVFARREVDEATKAVPTNEAARKLLKPALENLYAVINAFHINTQFEGIEETVSVLNETINRALASARQGS